jgi:hypothetical protein
VKRPATSFWQRSGAAPQSSQPASDTGIMAVKPVSA